MEIIALSIAILGAGMALLSLGVLSKENKERSYREMKRKYIEAQAYSHNMNIDMLGKPEALSSSKREYTNKKNAIETEYSTTPEPEVPIQKKKFGRKTKETKMAEEKYDKDLSEHQNSQKILKDKLEELENKYNNEKEKINNSDELELIEKQVDALKEEVSKGNHKKTSCGEYVIDSSWGSLSSSNQENSEKIGLTSKDTASDDGINKRVMLYLEKKTGKNGIRGAGYLSIDELLEFVNHENELLETNLVSETKIEGKKGVNIFDVSNRTYGISDEHSVSAILDELNMIKYAVKDKGKELARSKDQKFKEEYLSKLEAISDVVKTNFELLDQLDTKYKEQIESKKIEDEQKEGERQKDIDVDNKKRRQKDKEINGRLEK